MPEEFSPIEALREQAKLSEATPPTTTEYGLGTKTMPISSSEEAPVVTRVRGLMRLPPTPGQILDDIYTVAPALSRPEWRRFKTAASHLLDHAAFVAAHQQGENDDLD